MQCSTSNIFKPQVAPLWQGRPTKFPGPEEPNTIVQSPPRCHLRIKISTFVNLEGLFFFRNSQGFWTSSHGMPGVWRKFPFDLEIVSYQPNRATNDMSWPLLKTVPCKQWKQMFFKWVEKIVESCHANCIQVYRQKNWYRWTNSCLHQLVGKSPEFFKSHQSLTRKIVNSTWAYQSQIRWLHLWRRAITTSPPPPKKKKTRLVVMPLQQKHPPAIREKFWWGQSGKASWTSLI